MLITSSAALAQSAMPSEKVITFLFKGAGSQGTWSSKEKIVVGQALPETVVVTLIPDETGYAYAIVSDERVIVEPSTARSSRSSSSGFKS